MQESNKTVIDTGLACFLGAMHHLNEPVTEADIRAKAGEGPLDLAQLLSLARQ